MSTKEILPIEQAFREIKQNCSQAIKLYKTQRSLMYRGLKGTNVDAFKSYSRSDRKPSDSAIGLHELYNLALQTVGIKARRDNSIFVSGNYSQAREYGNVYVIFPVDGFNYSWSTVVDDVVLDQEDTDIWNDEAVNELRNGITAWINEKGIKGKPDFLMYRGLKESLALVPWKKVINDLYLVGYPGVAELRQNDFIDFGKFFDNYDPRASDLERALKTDHEILINGGYYAVNAHIFIDNYLPFI